MSTPCCYPPSEEKIREYKKASSRTNYWEYRWCRDSKGEVIYYDQVSKELFQAVLDMLGN